MSKLSFDALNSKLFSRSVQRWIQAARDVDDIDLPTLRRQSARAGTLKNHLNRFLHKAETRLSLPNGKPAQHAVPHNADWAWRPEIWRGPLPVPGIASVKTKTMFGDDLTLFHDCPFTELTLRQIKNLRDGADVPYGLQLDVFQFEGSFLSLVLDLPATSTDGLTPSHIVRMDIALEVERPIEIFGRLNVKHGPNTEQIVRELPMDTDRHCIEFDLGYSKLNEKRVERAWVDLIFDTPDHNQVILRDLTFSRRPRAQL